MPCIVRSLRDDELGLYLDIVNASIAGLAVSHYPAAAIQGWLVPATEANLAELAVNAEHEIRLIAEVDGQPVGIGALVLEGAELRACYVVPTAARQGVGTALVREIEARAVVHGLDHLELAASLNAEAFYAGLGYQVLGRSDLVLRNGHRLNALRMHRSLSRWS